MSLGEKQRLFARNVGRLIEFAYENGYELTFGDAYRDKRCTYGSVASLHRERLAVDFNLFKDGKYLTETEDHRPLGEFWMSLGGEWGGKEGRNDGNHYSWPYMRRW